MTEAEEVKNVILMGYIDLFQTSFSSSNRLSDIENFSCCFLSEGDRVSLCAPVSEEELKLGLWSLKPFKAPGADGLHAGFFQYFWADVKASVCREVCNSFEAKTVPKYLNETLISLIPKTQSPESLNNYKPISLCNTIYKVITKIIVGRIRPLLDKLISPVQAAFVPGRRGLDNIIIAQELIHSLDKKKGKGGFMTIKVDLAKAYDRIEWSFIHKVLKAFHFPQNLIELIMSCVTTTSISILFNGSKLNSFKPSRGIRQGDPLSPYLFILCMEYLGALIENECVAKRWIPIKASKDNVAISHLFFADDLMLFAKVSKEGCEAIKDVLDVFCVESGQKISLEKSRIYFSPNVQSNIKDKACEYLGIHETTNIGRYLSFPLRHKGATRRQFNFVAERVISKLAG